MQFGKQKLNCFLADPGIFPAASFWIRDELTTQQVGYAETVDFYRHYGCRDGDGFWMRYSECTEEHLDKSGRNAGQGDSVENRGVRLLLNVGKDLELIKN